VLISVIDYISYMPFERQMEFYDTGEKKISNIIDELMKRAD
jgi:hypothetical protein